MSITVFASAIAPWLFSRCHAALGSYVPAAAGTGLAAVALILFSCRADNPQDRLRQDGKAG